MSTLAPVTRGSGTARQRLRSETVGVDWILIAVGVSIALFGVLAVWAATKQSDTYLTKQGGYVVLGLGAMAAASLVDPARLARYPWVLLGGLCASVLVVRLVGTVVNGARRSINLGIFQLQPSELGKVVVIVMLAAIAIERAAELGTWRYTLTLCGVAGVPAFAVFLQPDLGTSLVYFAILASILLVVCVPWSHLATLGSVVVSLAALLFVILPAFGLRVLPAHQYARLLSFLSSSDDSSRYGYQVKQGVIAIGHGGATGTGLDNASQTFGFVPEQQTDFIFAALSEVFGFVGAAPLILAFGLLMWRGVRTITQASTRLDLLIASGIVGMFAFQVLINIGMNMKIMPITGIPLPFVSYGGSQTLVNFTALGLLVGIGRRSALVRR